MRRSKTNLNWIPTDGIWDKNAENKVKRYKLFNKLDIWFTQCKALTVLLIMYSTTTNYLECIKIYGDRSHDGTVTRGQCSHCTKPTRLSTSPHNSLKSEAQPYSLTDVP